MPRPAPRSWTTRHAPGSRAPTETVDNHRANEPAGRPTPERRLERAAALLRQTIAGRSARETVGVLACARLLEAVADATTRGEVLDARLLDVALGVALYMECLLTPMDHTYRAL